MNKKTFFMVCAFLALTGQALAASYGAITIYKFNDTDKDGVKDCSEKGMIGTFLINGSNGFKKTVSISPYNKLYTVIVPVSKGAVYTVAEINFASGYYSTVKNPKTVLISRVYRCAYDACGDAVLLKYGAKYAPVPPEKLLTAPNLLACIRGITADKVLFNNYDPYCANCTAQKALFEYEAGGLDAYYDIADPAGSISEPRWENTVYGTVSGCQNFTRVNELYGCNLVPVPGHVYMSC